LLYHSGFDFYRLFTPETVQKERERELEEKEAEDDATKEEYGYPIKILLTLHHPLALVRLSYRVCEGSEDTGVDQVPEHSDHRVEKTHHHRVGKVG
jgi:hypothetical protein